MIKLLVLIVILVVAHAVLQRWCSEKQVVSVIFAAGSHIPARALVAAAGFITLRLLVVLFLPGYVLARLVEIILRDRFPR